MYIQNAKIESTNLGYEDHGILSMNVNFVGPGWGQGTGCYAANAGMREWIKSMIDAVGVSRWEDLKGATVRIRRNSEYGPIVSVGNLLEEKWFDLPGAK